MVPGLILILLLCALNLVLMARRKEIKVEPAPQNFPKEVAKRGTSAFPALMMPVVILGGIYGGIMTPTEAAGVAVLYAIPVGWFIYRGLNRKTFVEALVQTGTTTGVVMVMFFTVMIVSRLLIFEDIPRLAEELIFSVSANPIVVLIMINIVIVIIGMLMDDVSGVLLASPLLLPIAQRLGVDPIHFAAIIGVNLGMGNVTPPTAPLLYLGARVANTQVRQDAVADHADDPVRVASDPDRHDLCAGGVALAAQSGAGPLSVGGGGEVKISEIVTTPLWIPYEQPYHWSQGVTYGAGVILVEVRTDEGVVGYGESIATPSAEGIQAFLARAAALCVGRSPFENARLMGEAYHALFELEGTCSAPRFAGQVLAGLEMALWDLMGKAVGRPVHELLGGAVRDEVRYFGFPQGATPEEVATEAGRLAASGYDVIYVKVGRGDALDTEVVAQVRAAIGPDKRLRLDPNEHWQPARAARMIRRLSCFDIELIEQPTHAESLDALARVRAASPVAIRGGPEPSSLPPTPSTPATSTPPISSSSACTRPAGCCASARWRTSRRRPTSTSASTASTRPASPRRPQTTRRQ